MEIENTGVLDSFPVIVATEDKVVPLRVLRSLENSCELEIELHYKGLPPRQVNVSIPSSNRLLVEEHLKQIWAEQKPQPTPIELPSEILMSSEPAQ